MNRNRWFSLSAALLLLLCLAAPASAQETAFRLNIEEQDGDRIVAGYTGNLPPVLVIPDGVTVIGEEAFLESAEIEQLVLPDSVREIRTAAFMSCTNLATAALPGALREIGMGAFCQCSSLEHVELPESLETIGMGAFGACAALEQITIPAKIRILSGTVFSYCAKLRSVNLPEGLLRVGAAAFGHCTALEELHLPSTLRCIEDAAFTHCTSLKSLEIPEGPTYLSYTFDNCTSLESLAIPASVTMIEGSVFERCDALATVHYGGTKAEWDKALSYGDSSLPSRVTLVCAGETPPAQSPGPAQPGAAVAPTLREDSGYEIQQTAAGPVLKGIRIGRPDSFTSVAHVVASFDAPEETSVLVCDARGEACELTAPVATGDVIQLYDSEGRETNVTVVISGDVIGSGLLNIPQLTRLAAAITGADPLVGPYLMAGAMTGGSQITIADLVRLAGMLVGMQAY